MTRDSPSMFIPVMPITLQASIDYLHELPNCTGTEMWLEATIRRSFSKCFPIALPHFLVLPAHLEFHETIIYLQTAGFNPENVFEVKVQRISVKYKTCHKPEIRPFIKGDDFPHKDHMIPRAKWSNSDFGRSSFSRLQLRRHHVVSLAFSDVPPGCQLIRRTTETSARALWLSEVMGKKRKKYPLVTWLAGKSEIFWRTCLMGTSPSNYYYTS